MTSWIDKLKKQFITAPAAYVSTEPIYMPPAIFTRGKWVMVQNDVGIISDVSNMNHFVIDFVLGDGTTSHRKQVEIGSVRLARLLDIPECRRPEPEIGAGLGYI
jgi:hypothetical protein